MGCHPLLRDIYKEDLWYSTYQQTNKNNIEKGDTEDGEEERV
jgi:hypothetical protein